MKPTPATGQMRPYIDAAVEVFGSAYLMGPSRASPNSRLRDFGSQSIRKFEGGRRADFLAAIEVDITQPDPVSAAASAVIDPLGLFGRLDEITASVYGCAWTMFILDGRGLRCIRRPCCVLTYPYSWTGYETCPIRGATVLADLAT
jgi:hypothetical protein